MTSDPNKQTAPGIDRRKLLTAGAAGVAAAGLGAVRTQAETVIPDPEKLWTNSKTCLLYTSDAADDRRGV